MYIGNFLYRNRSHMVHYEIILQIIMTNSVSERLRLMVCVFEQKSNILIYWLLRCGYVSVNELLNIFHVSKLLLIF